MRNVLLVLHILSAVLLVGPLTVGAFSAAATARQGADALPALRRQLRVDAVLGPATALVPLSGLALVAYHDAYRLGQGWVAGALVLFAVAAGNGAVLVTGALRTAIARLETGQSAAAEAARLTAYAVLALALVVALLWLMVAKPGL